MATTTLKLQQTVNLTSNGPFAALALDTINRSNQILAAKGGSPGHIFFDGGGLKVYQFHDLTIDDKDVRIAIQADLMLDTAYTTIDGNNPLTVATRKLPEMPATVFVRGVSPFSVNPLHQENYLKTMAWLMAVANNGDAEQAVEDAISDLKTMGVLGKTNDANWINQQTKFTDMGTTHEFNQKLSRAQSILVSAQGETSTSTLDADTAKLLSRATLTAVLCFLVKNQ